MTLSRFQLDLCKARILSVSDPKHRARLWSDKSALFAEACCYAMGFGMSDAIEFTDSDRRKVKRFRKQCRIVRLLKQNFNLLDIVIASVTGTSEELVRITRRHAGFPAVPVPF